MALQVQAVTNAPEFEAVAFVINVGLEKQTASIALLNAGYGLDDVAKMFSRDKDTNFLDSAEFVEFLALARPLLFDD